MIKKDDNYLESHRYRAGMSIDKITDILNDLAANGKLDKGIVDIANQNVEKCYEVAKGPNQSSRLYAHLFGD